MKNAAIFVIYLLSGVGIVAIVSTAAVVGIAFKIVSGSSDGDPIYGSAPLSLPTASPPANASEPTADPSPEPCKRSRSATIAPEGQDIDLIGTLADLSDTQIVLDTPTGSVNVMSVTNLDVEPGVQDGDGVYVRAQREGGILVATAVGRLENRCRTPSPTPRHKPSPSPTPAPTSVPAPSPTKAETPATIPSPKLTNAPALPAADTPSSPPTDIHAEDSPTLTPSAVVLPSQEQDSPIAHLINSIVELASELGRRLLH